MSAGRGSSSFSLDLWCFIQPEHLGSCCAAAWDGWRVMMGEERWRGKNWERRRAKQFNSSKAGETCQGGWERIHYREMSAASVTFTEQRTSERGETQRRRREAEAAEGTWAAELPQPLTSSETVRDWTLDENKGEMSEGDRRKSHINYLYNVLGYFAQFPNPLEISPTSFSDGCCLFLCKSR